MVRLHDIMTLDVLTVSPETTLRDAAGLLADEYVSGAPVVAGSRVVGGAYFVDLWDDAGAGVRARMASTEGPEWNVLEQHTVAELMTRTVTALGREASVREAAELMLKAHVHRILVMDDAKLVGLVTTTDVLKAVSQHGIAG